MSSTVASAGHSDPFDLERFVAAQATTYEAACRELAARRKQTHWMWFILPQMRGLGLSPMATRYGIASLDEARAYLAHPVLGPRLRHVVALLLAQPPCSARDLLGTPDDIKLRSSMTLFANVGNDNAGFRAVLARYFAGEEDEATLRLIFGSRA